MIKPLLVAGGVGALLVPGIALLTAMSVASSTAACLATSTTYGPLADTAPVSAATRLWVQDAVNACPALPEAWVAALIAEDAGLDTDTPAEVTGSNLCDVLDQVRAAQGRQPTSPAATLPVLDAVLVTLQSGAAGLEAYPSAGDSTAQMITAVDTTARAWSRVQTLDRPDQPSAPGELTNAPVPADSYPLRTAGSGCLPALGTAGSVTVPPGTPNDVTTAVRTALAYVGVTSGWDGLCDRLACRAYGFANAGHYSAATHWAVMNAQGRAHPGDTCPPLGSFVFFRSGAHAYGHASVVVQASPTCDPEQTLVTANGVFDRATGNHGGVYLLSFARLSAMYLGGRGYLGWSDPVCAGTPLPAGTVHPAPSGW